MQKHVLRIAQSSKQFQTNRLTNYERQIWRRIITYISSF